MTNIEPLGERIRNDIVYLIAVVGTDLNKLKTCVVVAIKLTGELNPLSIAYRSKAFVNN